MVSGKPTQTKVATTETHSFLSNHTLCTARCWQHPITLQYFCVLKTSTTVVINQTTGLWADFPYDETKPAFSFHFLLQRLEIVALVIPLQAFCKKWLAIISHRSGHAAGVCMAHIYSSAHYSNKMHLQAIRLYAGMMHLNPLAYMLSSAMPQGKSLEKDDDKKATRWKTVCACMQLLADVDNFSTWLLFQEANFMGLYVSESLCIEMWLQLLQQQPVGCAQQLVCESRYFN